MKLERSDIDHPVWRKKVDTSLLKLGYTPIPSWVLKIWNIETLFGDSFSKKLAQAKVELRYKGRIFEGHITNTKRSKPSDFYRLFVGKELCDELKAAFAMSYVRCIESDLRKRAENRSSDIEKEIPFWEFLAIEFDSSTKTFYLVAHYSQKPVFPEVFKNLIRTSILKQFETESELEFQKNNWHRREDLQGQLETVNVIYYPVDTKSRLLYVGEAENLYRRFVQGHSCIKEWDYYRYEVLPDGFSKRQRVSLERMLIRSFATLLRNTRGVPSLELFDYTLANTKIDQ